MPLTPDFQYDVFLSHNAQDKPRALLLCISPTVLASGWVAMERSTAVHRDLANAGRRFIPLLLGDCALPDTLRRCKVVDFIEESEAIFAEVSVTCQAATGGNGASFCSPIRSPKGEEAEACEAKQRHHLAPQDCRCGKTLAVYQFPALPTCTASSLRETASLN